MSLAKTFGIFAAVATFVSAMASGCSTRDETESPKSDPLKTAAGFCTKLAEAVCNKEVVLECFTASEDALDEVTETCVKNAAITVCDANAGNYNSKAAQACIDAVQDLYDERRLEREEIDAAVEVCLEAVHGDLGVGQACDNDQECDGSLKLRCIGKPAEPDMLANTCQEPVESEPGGDCAAADAVCPDTFYCDVGEHCVARQDALDPCDAVTLCVETALCISSVCIAKKPDGDQTCTAPAECAGGFCLIKSGDVVGQCGSFTPVNFDTPECDKLTG
jgi:hypothetical protein